MADQYLGTPVIAFLALTILTWAAVIVSTQELSTTTGDTVNIPCLFGDGTLSSIFWAYNDGTGRHKILSLANWDLTIEPEYASRASLQKDNSTLILKDITVADEGTYRCDVDRQGQTVVTNINTNLNVFSLRPDTLPVISPCTVADESLSCSIHVNQSFTLTSILSNVYPVKDTELIWYQDGQRVSFTNDVNTQNDDGTTDVSRQIQVSETGNFTCNATFVSANGRENIARSVEAWIIPLSDEPNTPGKNMTSGEIALKAIGILLSVLGISLGIVSIFFIYRSKAKGQRSSRNDTNDSEGNQLCQARASPTEEPDIDDILMAIAEKIHDDHINHLGKELGFDTLEIERYVARNSPYMNFNCTGTLAMLRDWVTKRFKARERAALQEIFMDIGLGRLAEYFFSEEGSGLPKSTDSTERGALKTALEQSGQIRLADDLLPSVEYSTLPEYRFVNRTDPVPSSSLDILDSFIRSGLHPNGNRRAVWPKQMTVVCLIDYSYNSTDIVIKHNTPQLKHAEEILIEYINSELDLTKIKRITIYSNYSSCTQCSGKLQILKEEIPDLQIKFSALYNIRRQSCAISGCCRTADPESFKMLRKLDARPFEKDDWDNLINLLANDEQKGYPTSDLDGLRYGDHYRVWRNGEDEKMMADYMAMTRRNGEDGNMIADYQMKSQ